MRHETMFIVKSSKVPGKNNTCIVAYTYSHTFPLGNLRSPDYLTGLWSVGGSIEDCRFFLQTGWTSTLCYLVKRITLFLFLPPSISFSLYWKYLVCASVTVVLLPAMFQWLTNKLFIHGIVRLPKKLNLMFIHSFRELAYLRLSYSSFPCFTLSCCFSQIFSLLSSSFLLFLVLCLSA